MEGKLVLVRHGESQWNAKDLWTGWTDIGLTEKGKQEARRAGDKLKDIAFDAAYTSRLSRAKETLKIILDTIGQSAIPVYDSEAINERNYGIYTGKNKFEIKRQIGDEAFLHIRRGWDYPIPQGESLKQIYERVAPYYEKEILPHLQSGKNILIAAHGNSLRALMKYLEHISDEDIAGVELATGEVVVYHIDHVGNVLFQERR